MNINETTTGRRDRGFTLIEILIAIVLVGILSAVVVVAIGRLTENASSASCAASADAARTATNTYFALNAKYPTTMSDMTTSTGSGPALELPSSVTVSGLAAIGNGWTLTMSPGTPPTFACTTGSSGATPVSVPSGCSPTTAGWFGEYFANQNLSGASTLCRDDASVNFDWGGGVPAPGLPADNFSVRWTKTATFNAGSYMFTMGSDDGGRLFVDGTNVLDRWYDQGYPGSPPSVTLTMTAGSHLIVLEYYENGGQAKATLNWAEQVMPASCSGPFANWKAEYYPSVDLSGFPALCRDDAAVNFDWGTGSPTSSLPSDNFSVRWTSAQTFTAGSHTFVLGSDDGGRLFIDGVKVLDVWVDQAYPTPQPSVTRTLTAGPHTIVVEYYERGGYARATLTWT